MTNAAIFPGLILVDCHLSVDRNYSLNNATQTASHMTMVFKKQDTEYEGRVIHVYFDQDNQLMAEPIRMFDCILDRLNHVREQQGLALPMTHQQFNALYSNEQFQEYKNLLNNLSKEKANAYVRLRSFSFQLEEQLSEAAGKKDWVKAKAIAEELKELTEKITRYNDVLMDGRTTHLTNLLSFYDECIKKSVVQPAVTVALDTVLEDMDISLEPLALKNQSSAPETEETQLKSKIIHLVQVINSLITDPNIPSVEILIKRHHAFEEFKESCLILSFLPDSTKKIQKFIAKQKANIALNNDSLLTEFVNFVQQGDLDSVMRLHDIVSDHYDLAELYSRLVTSQ